MNGDAWNRPKGSEPAWSYTLIRLLFQFVLKIFYGTIVVENAHLIPKNGQPCMVCSNHPNSLTDALLLVTAVPTRFRSMLRLTAKATQFGHRNFTSWLIESAGTIPIKRKKDYDGSENVDNSEAMLKLLEALELGDAICFFPEGASRYHPTIAPLKTGVARMISDSLSRNRNIPDYEVSLLTCSITYMHRQHFRSDVLITFHQPMTFRPKDNPELLAPVDYSHIRALTSKMHEKISSGTIDSPSWGLVRTSKLAAQIYAPLGTQMRLGDYIRVTKTFLEAFKLAEKQQNAIHSSSPDARQLCGDIKSYQDELVRLGIKDDRIRRPLSRRTILTRILVRLPWSLFLFTISLPGLLLWFPVFATTFVAVHNFKKSGPIWDTWDEIAQYKLIYGLASGLCVWSCAVLLTLPFASVTFLIIPALMWITLRWLEDAMSAFRAFAALVRLLRVGKPTLKAMNEKRTDLHSRVVNLGVHHAGLPENPEAYFAEVGGKQKGRVRGQWGSRAAYFSMRRRRKRDWNETLRLFDKVDYPDEGI